jgi:hypothetical protein
MTVNARTRRFELHSRPRARRAAKALRRRSDRSATSVRSAAYRLQRRPISQAPACLASQFPRRSYGAVHPKSAHLNTSCRSIDLRRCRPCRLIPKAAASAARRHKTLEIADVGIEMRPMGIRAFPIRGAHKAHSRLMPVPGTAAICPEALNLTLTEEQILQARCSEIVTSPRVAGHYTKRKKSYVKVLL